METKTAVLNQAERDVLVLAATHPGGRHLSNTEIARRLGISVNRVKTLMHQACVKLGAHTRGEAIFLATFLHREIAITEILSPEEIEEMFGSLGHDVLVKIAHLMRKKQAYGFIPDTDREISHAERRQKGILTQRERDVLILSACGLTNEEIARRLYVSVSAVRTFHYRIGNKLGARKRTDIVNLALRRGEINPGEILSLDELIEVLAPLGPESIENMAHRLRQKLEQEHAIHPPDTVPCLT